MANCCILCQNVLESNEKDVCYGCFGVDKENERLYKIRHNKFMEILQSNVKERIAREYPQSDRELLSSLISDNATFADLVGLVLSESFESKLEGLGVVLSKHFMFTFFLDIFEKNLFGNKEDRMIRVHYRERIEIGTYDVESVNKLKIPTRILFPLDGLAESDKSPMGTNKRKIEYSDPELMKKIVDVLV